MSTRTKVSSQGRTVIPIEIRENLGIREGEEVEWSLEGEVIMVKPARGEETPDEIIEYLKDHPAEIRRVYSKATLIDIKRRMLDEWARRKLGLTP